MSTSIKSFFDHITTQTKTKESSISAFFRQLIRVFWTEWFMFRKLDLIRLKKHTCIQEAVNNNEIEFIYFTRLNTRVKCTTDHKFNLIYFLVTEKAIAANKFLR